MSLYGLSDLQLAQNMPKAAPYYYGNTPVQVNQTGGWVNGVQPGGVSSIGTMPVKTGVAVDPSAGLPSTGMPAGAATSAAGGGYANIATQAIQGIADAAQTYVAAKAKADILRNTKPVPEVPESQGALMGFNAPQLKGLGGGALSIG